MRQHQQHPSKIEIMALIALGILVVGEALIFVAQQIVTRCGPFCGVMFFEPAVRMFSK